ncbi:DUF4436 domain-containing protein [Microbacterium resistens]|uniref:DUF4436 family protein n=1 Tax=Microbacterium resistens TaxID=156977 RepID=UPI001C56AA7D|nr:DUF4436 family protein [Microbacterium resistens]MBW1637699.1 DUF4436 domain-containing protein [Microbacterium resistens]
MSGLAKASRRRPFPTFIVVCALVFVALYAAVVLLYARGTAPVTSPSPADEDPAAVHVRLTPTDVDAGTDRLSFDVSLTTKSREQLSEASDGGDVVVLFTSAGGSSTVTFAGGYLDVPQTVRLPTSGQIEQWPFDRHPARTLVTVGYTAGDGASQTLPGGLVLDAHHVPGWVISLAPTDQRYVLGQSSVVQYEIEVRRATAAIAFGLVLLALMVIMPVLGLTVAIMVFRGRRRVEVGFFTWNAGMLFATPTLRNFLPGQPPVGSWVDYLVVLWVIAGLILALMISVVGWYRWGSPQPEVTASLRVRASARRREALRGHAERPDGAAPR